jgi:hypothetical protein
MSQSIRQTNLFLGQDWTVIYNAMSAINFAAYDYDTIRQALIDYIRVNYPEDFNDWISSSEFVAIIEMLAYLGGNLAFRVDLNTRENFLTTAQRRESLMRLARFLSYNPRRCLAGQGLLKLTQVRTDQTIYDSNGTNLQNLTINWNDTTNPDWYEQFILVLNAAFQPSNPFGQPVKNGSVGSIIAARYDFNNTTSNNLAYAYNATVSGTRMNFEFVNPDFEPATGGSINTGSSGYYKEKAPNVFNSWSMIYRNDGNGNSSTNTGFFAMFKQGTLAYTDYLLDTPVPNRVIDIAATNVNQNDVWVQTVDDTGIPLLDWTKVPAIFNSNLVYNDLDRLTRNIYQVVTRDVNGVDSISIRFGDGNFGNVPTGRIRVYYRTSNNLTYTVQPQDMSFQNLTLGYQSQLNTINNLTMQYSLQYPVANSLSRESSDSIRERAPAVYYAQNRMVNGEDYNVFPLQNSQALKIKAVNRVYSGQSRFLDINDPTSQYSNVKVFSDDGILYQEYTPVYKEVFATSNLNTNQFIESVVQPLLSGSTDTDNVNIGLRDFYLENYPYFPGGGLYWQPTGGSVPNAAQGQFVYTNSNSTATPTQIFLPDKEKGLVTGSMVKFTREGWVNVVNQGSSELGIYSTILSRPVSEYLTDTGTVKNLVQQIMPPIRVTLTEQEKASISNAVQAKRNFGLRYDNSAQTWIVLNAQDVAINAAFSLDNAGDVSKTNIDASWLVQFVYLANFGWQITMRALNYYFESVRDVQFYFVNTQKIVDSQTLTSRRDNVRILKNNMGSNGSSLADDQYWAVQSQQVYPDGYIEPRVIQVVFWDSNNDNLVDNPQLFDDLVTNNSRVFWKKANVEGFERWNPTTVKYQVNLVADLTSLQPPANVGDVAYVINPGIFLECINASTQSWQDISANYKARSGTNRINYCWQHFAGNDKRIDPAIMNIIDIYVLTNSYNTAIRNWISKGRPTDPHPQPPTPEDLRSSFEEFNAYKMMTDQLIWHPIRYKLLFGEQADPQLQAVFKVVKIPSSTITDREIKNRVIQAIDDFFNIANWDFGQSFFFTELAAYIHQQMANLLSSVVIVPASSNSKFGDLFEIKSDPDQLFLSTARVTDVLIVPNLNPAELRIA